LQVPETVFAQTGSKKTRSATVFAVITSMDHNKPTRVTNKVKDKKGNEKE